MNDQSITHATGAWLDVLSRVLRYGSRTTPRGKVTTELLNTVVTINMYQPVVAVKERGLNYSFMAAEALWILNGDDAVAPLVKHVPAMREFSDNGVTLAGAYGPRIVKQLPYVVGTLLQDRDTRQAVLTTWDRNPPPSKDIPCTVAMQFMIRENQLHVHVSMRSSDLWLGLPYDLFSFSMIGAWVATEFNREMREHWPKSGHLVTVGLGSLCVTAMSSHLYLPNWDAAAALASRRTLLMSARPDQEPVPEGPIREGKWEKIAGCLVACEKKLQEDDVIWRVRP